MQLQLSCFQVQPVARRRTYPRETDVHIHTCTQTTTTDGQTATVRALSLTTRMCNPAKPHIKPKYRQSSSLPCYDQSSLVKTHRPSLSRCAGILTLADPSNISTGTQSVWYPCLNPGPSQLLVGSPTPQLVQPDTLLPTDAHLHTRHTSTQILQVSAWPWPLCPDPEPPTHWVVQLEALYMYKDTQIRLGENKNAVPPRFLVLRPSLSPVAGTTDVEAAVTQGLSGCWFLVHLL